MTKNVANDHQQPNIPLLHEIGVAEFNGCNAISVANQKVGSPGNFMRGPGNFIVPPPFNFYFNPCHSVYTTCSLCRHNITYLCWKWSHACLGLVIITTVQLSLWPEDVRTRMTFTLHPIQFPDGPSSEVWRKLFKLCASQRIFIPVSRTLFVVRISDEIEWYLLTKMQVSLCFAPFSSFFTSLKWSVVCITYGVMPTTRYSFKISYFVTFFCIHYISVLSWASRWAFCLGKNTTPEISEVSLESFGDPAELVVSTENTLVKPKQEYIYCIFFLKNLSFERHILRVKFSDYHSVCYLSYSVRLYDYTLK